MTNIKIMRTMRNRQINRDKSKGKNIRKLKKIY